MQIIPIDIAKELSHSLLEPEPEKEEDLPVETDESVQTEPVINNATKQQEPIQHAEHKQQQIGDRKSTRLNSSHVAISYAVFCLKKKTQRLTTHISHETTGP